MKSNNDLKNSFYKDLKALSQNTFPKVCKTCGLEYQTEEDFIFQTQSIKASSGLKESFDDETPVVELFRNCICGSTLMDVFSNRRDTSPAGQRRREKFDEIIDKIINSGYDREVAHRELLKFMRGEVSEVIDKLTKK